MTKLGHALLAAALLAGFVPHVTAQVPDVVVDPVAVQLRGATASWSLLVHGKTADGRQIDRTQLARFRSSDEKIATVTPSGIIRPVGDGKTNVLVEVDGKTLPVSVAVSDTTLPRRFNFENDVLPILSRFGCNSSGCHGKAEGQNGFKLSVFGFDPPADYAALMMEGRGRRVFPSAPEHSLLLRKVSGQAAHGGGVKVPRGSPDFETLRAWIAVGAPYGSSTDPTVAGIRVEPSERSLAPRGRQQLRIIARFTDGREADVTAHAKFQSNNDGLAAVQPNGLVTAGDLPGEAAVMASYMNEVDVFRLVVPRTEKIASYPDLPENNFIDRLVFQKLRKLNILPSDLSDDAEYLRRVYLDVIGTLPTPAEVRRFLADKRPDRRAQVVEELLRRPEFADYWALQWADLLRVDRGSLGHKRAYAYYRWIRASVADNKPLDQFTREIITAEGPLGEVAPATFYKAMGKPGETASTLAQVFLGVRIACAECHHHPFDRWSQTDYFGMQAFFLGVGIGGAQGQEMLTSSGNSMARHPRTGANVMAHPLGERMPTEIPKGDHRATLAAWMTRPDNPFFAKSLANRIWAHLLGRGLVEPVDDMRATNPPTNPELLDALAKFLVDNKYDFKALVRTITASRIYQLSSSPNATNERDEQNYSRALFKRPPAEVLFDMVCQSTGVPERFGGALPGTRAIQLWDSKVTHYFLKTFGRPERKSACECERVGEPSVAQVLHLLNAPEIHAKLTHDAGTVARLVARDSDDDRLVEELYLTYFSRLPGPKERETASAFMKQKAGQRRQAAEDLAWTLMNSLEFAFNH